MPRYEYKCPTIVVFFLLSTLFSFNYSPRRFEIIESANTTVEYQLILQNRRELTENISVNLNTWTVSNNNVSFQPFQEDWFRVPLSDFTLSPGEEKRVPFVINVPNVSGEKRIEINLKTQFLNSNFVLNKGIPIFLIIKGTESVDIALEDLEIIAASNTDAKVVSHFKNGGNIHIRPRVEIRLGDSEKWLRVADDVPIYPYSERTVTKIIDTVSEFLDQKLEVRMMYYDTQGQLITKNYIFSI